MDLDSVLNSQLRLDLNAQLILPVISCYINRFNVAQSGTIFKLSLQKKPGMNSKKQFELGKSSVLHNHVNPIYHNIFIAVVCLAYGVLPAELEKNGKL